MVRKLCSAAAIAAVCALFATELLVPGGALAQTTSPEVQGILNAIGGQPVPSVPTPASQVPSSPAMPANTTIAPAAAPQPTAAAPAPVQSHLEQLYSQRAGRPLTQYGYDTFGVGSAVPVTQIGALQDSYILGVGDQLNIVLRGHENTAYSAQVDREGRIILPELAPINAAGRTFGDVRTEIAQRVAKQQIGSQAFVSIGTVRQVGVLVTGEVATPGVRTLTGLNTPVDAILLSGGIKKTGSLRDVTLVRGGRRIRLDLYALIGKGTYSTIGALTEGDRIIVPAIGQTVAVAGLVKSPGIFELAPGASAITQQSLISLAGGTELAGAKRLTKLALEPSGKTEMVPVAKSGIVRSGEVLFVDFERSASNGVITLMGEVTVPGTRALSATPTISRLIRDADDLTPQSYTLYGVIIRRESKSNFQSIIPFSIARTFEHKEDVALADNDLVYVFNQSEVAALAAAADTALVGSSSASQNPLAILRPPTASSTSATLSSPSAAGSPTTTPSIGAASVGAANPAPSTGATAPAASGSLPASALPGSTQSTIPTTSTAAALQAANAPQQSVAAVPVAPPSSVSSVLGIAQAQATQTATGGAASVVANTKPAQVSVDQIASNLGIPTIELVNSARDYLVSINGEVRNPGSYLAVGDTSLASLIDAAGGLQREADLSSVEITSTLIDPTSGTSRTVRNSLRITGPDFASVSLKPFDSVRLRPVFSDRNGETVTILGQVRYPGTFDVTRGERLSSVLARAGGLTDEAYPFGTVFTRQSAAITEADGNQRTAKLLEDNIATAATLPSTLVNSSGLVYVENLAQELRTMPALGRISVTADPVVLATKPDLDVLMEAGDTVYVPKRPSSVTVTGEVLSGGAFAYKPNLTVQDYITLAGGEGGASDDSLTFVVLPDGTSRPAGDSWWSFGAGHEIPPGSMIVVPRDPTPFNWMEFALNMSDIISKVATTAASLAVIGSLSHNNNGSGN